MARHEFVYPDTMREELRIISKAYHVTISELFRNGAQTIITRFSDSARNKLKEQENDNS